MIKLLAEYAERDPGIAPKLFAAVADQVRARLKPDDAAIIASWFDRLAAGETPERVFPHKKAGRPKGKTTKPRPDDFDIANIVRQSIEAGREPGEVYEGVAKAHGMKPRTVANIYSKLKSEI